MRICDQFVGGAPLSGTSCFSPALRLIFALFPGCSLESFVSFFVRSVKLSLVCVLRLALLRPTLGHFGIPIFFPGELPVRYLRAGPGFIVF